ncbi:MAG: RluA family pseudouridine synthase [Planctomycetota bacterium]|nr:RluA family pseudouridine synthase [Planctomycetota bacterium]
MPLPTILHEQSGVVAILKPVGLATQAPPGLDSVERWLRTHLARGDDGYVGVPHRLDRAVSGVVLMTATPRAARKLSRQFERRQVLKTYLAVVEPRPGSQLPRDGVAREWRDHLRKVAEQARTELVEPAAAGGREAVTRVHLHESGGSGGARALLRLEPLTGRMHQLRIQAASRGLPIVGDELYGGPPLEGGVELGQPILLHAWRIEYDDPDSGERVDVTAPLPSHWPAAARPA